MTECCSESQDTAYCSYCGKYLGGGHPLQALLKHCRKTYKKLESQQKRDERGLASEDSEGVKIRCEYRIGLLKKSKEKWKAWSDALELSIEDHTWKG